MTPRPGSRLAIVAVLLALQVVAFAVDISSLRTRTPIGTKRYNAIRMFIVPTAITILSVILVSITFSKLDDTSEMGLALENNHCTSVDADISGIGARIAVWAQIGILVAVSFVGAFHAKATGVKEVGVGIMLTHVSLVIALLVQLRRGTLSPADAIIGAIIVDAQNMASAIQLSAKETLAARWQVATVTITQAFGLAVLPVLISRFSSGATAAGDNCSCLTVFWWAWLSNCEAFPTTEMSIFWTYYACRCIGFCQVTFASLYNTQRFHLSEKFKQPINIGVEYDGYPSTVTFMFAFYGLLSIVSMAAAEMTMKTFHISPSSSAASVGQIIGLVIAVATFLHALWQFVKLFKDHYSHQRLGFSLPLSLRPIQQSWNLDSTTTFPDIIPELDLRLGYIFTSTSDISSPFVRDIVPLPEELKVIMEQADIQLGWTLRTTVALGSLFRDEIVVRMPRLRTESFNPRAGFILERLEQPRMRGLLSGRRRLYMVTGIRVVSGLEFQREVKQVTNLCFLCGLGKQAQAEAWIAEQGDPAREVFSGDVVWAYQMRTIQLDRSGRVRIGRQYSSRRWRMDKLITVG